MQCQCELYNLKKGRKGPHDYNVFRGPGKSETHSMHGCLLIERNPHVAFGNSAPKVTRIS